MVVIMIPNIAYPVKCKSNTANIYKSKVAEIIEHISICVFGVYDFQRTVYLYADIIKIGAIHLNWR